MRRFRFPILLLTAGLIGLAAAAVSRHYWIRRHAFMPVAHAAPIMRPELLSPFQRALLADLNRQVRAGIRYQDGYYRGGDPPASIGVCTDVVIRAFRAAGVDLQQLVADDIRAHPAKYGIERPDPNIDHRRCRNLAVFFRYHAVSLPTAGTRADWRPGDLVFWDTTGRGKADHVGMIANGRASTGDPTIIHHWPGLPVAETEGLNRFTVRYHFRWPGA